MSPAQSQKNAFMSPAEILANGKNSVHDRNKVFNLCLLLLNQLSGKRRCSYARDCHGFDSRAGQIGWYVANGSPPLPRFFVALLPRRVPRRRAPPLVKRFHIKPRVGYDEQYLIWVCFFIARSDSRLQKQ